MMVTVYRYRCYEPQSHRFVTSRCWATADAIKRMHGGQRFGKGTEVDESAIDSEGMMAIGLDPPRTVFQNEWLTEQRKF